MGMFDSLYIELDGQELEVQTKRFDCGLGSYRVGDWIDGAPPGIRVYFDRLTFDDTGKHVYQPTAEASRALTLFVVLAHAVFVEYQLSDGHLAPDAIEHSIRDLRARWSDSARLVGFLVESVRKKQQTVEQLSGRIARVSSVLASARRLQAGEELGGLLGLIREEDRKLASGEPLLDVVEWLLNDQTHGWERWGTGATPDPLAEYRL